ncbi:MAG: YwaF family protein [Clostridia bacterium]|nr:YwaF family protein [Clostridia bacterium]
MIIGMFNGWYFFWLLLLGGITTGLYFLLRNKSVKIQKAVLFSILVLGLIAHFTKVYYPPYSTDEARMLRDSWFVNICGANIALFPFMFFMKNEKVKNYMFYIGVISGLIALFYPQEPLAKGDQLGEQLDIIRFYFHHWMLLAVPLLMVLFKHHKISYKKIYSAPTGLLCLMLFIMLNQIFQSELGFIPLRDNTDFFDINYKNSSYIWGPGTDDAIGDFLAAFCPKFFKTIPVGEYAGQEKYWPWFWLIVPVYLIVPFLCFLISLIFDHKSFVSDVKLLWAKVCAFISSKTKKSDAAKEAEALVAEAAAEDAKEEVTVTE